MRKISTLFAVTAMLAIAGTSADAQTNGGQLAVAEAQITSNVVDRQPADNLATAASDVGELYCWTRITGAESEIQLEHVWYHGENEMARVSLNVAGSNWRTWSSKNIMADRAGEWRVDIVGPDGSVLDSVKFTIGS